MNGEVAEDVDVVGDHAPTPVDQRLGPEDQPPSDHETDHEGRDEHRRFAERAPCPAYQAGDIDQMLSEIEQGYLTTEQQ